MSTTPATLPVMRLTDPAFQYRRRDETNIAETFARVRERMRQQAQAEGGDEAPLPAQAKPVRRVRAGPISTVLMYPEGLPC